MSSPTVVHLVIGIALTLVGIVLLRRRAAPVLAWILCVSGVAFGLSGAVVPMVHRHFFH